MADMARGCRDGSWRSDFYQVFQIFPNLLLSHFHAGDDNWYISIQQYEPLAHDRTRTRSWVYPAVFLAPRKPWHDRWTRRFTRPLRSAVVGRIAKRIMLEDNAVCEQQQALAVQVSAPPRLGALEERIAWFEEAYQAAMQRA
jgi:hypothetical protein